MPPRGSGASTFDPRYIELFLEVVVSGYEVLLADIACSSVVCGLYLSPAPRMSSLLLDILGQSLRGSYLFHFRMFSTSN